MSTLQTTIESAFENRAEITPANAPGDIVEAVNQALALIDSGEARVAEPTADGWQVNDWLKKAVLLSFRINDNAPMEGGFTRYFDKVASKFDGYTAEQFAATGCRVVPPAVVRNGCFIGRNVVLMPSYVNIGAYVDEGTMVDTLSLIHI